MAGKGGQGWPQNNKCFNEQTNEFPFTVATDLCKSMRDLCCI